MSKRAHDQKNKAYDRTYTKSRHKAHKAQMILELGGKCWNCNSTEGLDIFPRHGHSIPIAAGGRYLRALSDIRKAVLPNGMVVCKKCR